jgi:hypothetical protein
MCRRRPVVHRDKAKNTKDTVKDRKEPIFKGIQMIGKEGLTF